MHTINHWWRNHLYKNTTDYRGAVLKTVPMVLSLGEYWIPVVLPQTSNDILKSFNLVDRNGICIT